MSDLQDAPSFFGEYGGSFVPPVLTPLLDDVTDAFLQAKRDPAFLTELDQLLRQYSGRPTPITPCANLSRALGGAQIFLKREDLNHLGAHKINNTLGQILLARRMGKRKVIAETGAGQHGVATAAAAALMGLECEIYMGEEDIARQRLNVFRMELMGAKVIAARSGQRTLKEAVDEALGAYIQAGSEAYYLLGSAVGPHPYPQMVRYFQSVIGHEARAQMLALTGALPHTLVACVGGGSNAIGLFAAFLDDPVAMRGVEPSGRSLAPGEHAATLTLGRPGVLHGFRSYLLQDERGEPAPVYSISAGLDYPGVGPEHAHLKDTGRVTYVTASDQDALDAFVALARHEGIIPALESAHALAHAMALAPTLPPEAVVLVNLSGRGDKDVERVEALLTRS